MDDYAFLVKHGETAEVGVPTGEYTLFLAMGTDWYGSDTLFGESAVYYRDSSDVNLYIEGSSAYGFQMEMPLALSNSNNINYSSFPR